VLPLQYFPVLGNGAAPCGGKNDALFGRDRKIAGATLGLVLREPRSEAALVRAAAEKFAGKARILLGNSLAIREWDLVVPRAVTNRTFFANRGVNGIDGLVSTALGLAAEDRPAAALLGDLSALYDMAGLWPAAQLAGADITIAVVNNGGGKIFERMFKNAAFLNTHKLHFRGWAEMFGWHYGQMHAPEDPWPASSPRLVEILPDAEATGRFAEAYAALWSRISG
jgi:2-succinyl-5-enolpyruvyl-6-hydroxy-3-cyclohexene-1-carboxylate synthase